MTQWRRTNRTLRNPKALQCIETSVIEVTASTTDVHVHIFVVSVHDMENHSHHYYPRPSINQDVYVKCILLDFVTFVSSLHSMYCDMAAYFGLPQFIKFS